MKVIIYKNNEAGVSVVIPTGELSIEEVLKKDCPQGTIIDDSTLPSRDFRNAWELLGNTVSVNFVKAKDITKDRLRVERSPLLAAQDVAFQRALESGADTASIVAEKQRLRDITNLADTATMLDELKSLTAKIEAIA
jgi:hypothetical protein